MPVRPIPIYPWGCTISVDGAVRGGETGITALGGDGDVAVTTSGGIAFGGGQVDGAAGVHAAARNGDLTVSATGEWLDRIVGYGDGIRAVSSGTGAVSISATIVPQAQISMSGVSGDGFVSGSLDVAESSAASLDGRIGLAAEIALREGYLRFSGSLLRALSELDGTVINGRTVEHGLPDGWAEFAVGGSLDLSEDRVLFLDGTWRTGLGGGGGDAGGASISGGLKVNW